MSVQQEKFKEIADAIREKTGSEDLIKPSAFAEKVGEVYEAGKQAQYFDWWYKYLKKDKPYLNMAESLFGGRSWTDETFYPPYDIVLAGSNASVFSINQCTNIRQRLIDMGVKITTPAYEKITVAKYFFYSTITTELPDIEGFQPTNMEGFTYNNQKLLWMPEYDTSKCTLFTSYCYGNKSLERIEGIDFSSATTINNAFTLCEKLAEINVKGTIPVSINFSYSPLSVASLKSVITHLKDYAGTANEYTYTLTLKSDCWAALDAEGATAPGGITWRDYVSNLGWITD